MTSLRSLAIGAAACSALLAGCATHPQRAMSLDPAPLAVATTRVGVVMTPMVKGDVALPGADCLLCRAAASAMNSSLTAYAGTLPAEDLVTIKEQVAERIRKRGASVKVLSEDLNLQELPDFGGKGDNLAKKDFTSLAKRYEVDELVVIEITRRGFERAYSSYVPTSDPKAIVRGFGYMVNLKSNTLEWYLPLHAMYSAEGKWDEPAKYPGLTNAYFHAIETTRDNVLQVFSQ